LYVLDEPSVGLHARDTARLVGVLEKLRDLGNTVLVVEHEPAVMRAADHVVDLGPGRGEAGGQVVFQGPFADLLRSDISLTGQYSASTASGRIAPTPGQDRTVVPRAVRAKSFSGTIPSEAVALHEAAVPYGDAHAEVGPSLKIRNASRHNLKNVTVEIPLQRFVCLTGVSGSGKTTLVREVLLPALEAHFKSAAAPGHLLKASDRLDADPAASAGDDESETESHVRPSTSAMSGHEQLSQVVLVDQSPIGKTPRSNPVVYIGAFDALRELLAQTEPARQRGLNASAFSFNSRSASASVAVAQASRRSRCSF
jgi:excinuclease ABC subunit A